MVAWTAFSGRGAISFRAAAAHSPHPVAAGQPRGQVCLERVLGQIGGRFGGYGTRFPEDLSVAGGRTAPDRTTLMADDPLAGHLATNGLFG
jgi:hypothetical protein